MNAIVNTDSIKMGNAGEINISLPARQGWEAQFEAMAECGDDHLLDEELVNGSQWDKDEWKWELSKE